MAGGYHDVGIVDGRNKLVPRITFRIKKSTEDGIRPLSLNLAFKQLPKPGVAVPPGSPRGSGLGRGLRPERAVRGQPDRARRHPDQGRLHRRSAAIARRHPEALAVPGRARARLRQAQRVAVGRDRDVRHSRARSWPSRWRWARSPPVSVLWSAGSGRSTRPRSSSPTSSAAASSSSRSSSRSSCPTRWRCSACGWRAARSPSPGRWRTRSSRRCGRTPAANTSICATRTGRSPRSSPAGRRSSPDSPARSRRAPSRWPITSAGSFRSRPGAKPVDRRIAAIAALTLIHVRGLGPGRLVQNIAGRPQGGGDRRADRARVRDRPRRRRAPPPAAHRSIAGVVAPRARAGDVQLFGWNAAVVRRGGSPRPVAQRAARAGARHVTVVVIYVALNALYLFALPIAELASLPGGPADRHRRRAAVRDRGRQSHRASSPSSASRPASARWCSRARACISRWRATACSCAPRRACIRAFTRRRPRSSRRACGAACWCCRARWRSW